MRNIYLAATALAFAASLSSVCGQRPFITEWKTTDGTITIPTNSAFSSYDFEVKYYQKNDSINSATVLINQTSNVVLNVVNTDTIMVEIKGIFPSFYMNNDATNSSKLLNIKQWGDIQWQSFSKAFNGCSNLKMSATDIPNLTNVTTLEKAFSGATLFNGNISNWNVSNVVNMSLTFANASSFNCDLGSWAVSNVTNMDSLFYLSGMSYCNFDLTIIGWNQIALKPGINLGSGSSSEFPKHSSIAAMALNLLTSAPNNWNLVSSLYQKPTLNIVGNILTCKEDHFYVQASSSLPTMKFLWPNNTTAPAYLIYLEQDTQVVLRGEDPQELGCFLYDTLNIVLDTTPIIKITASVNPVCIGSYTVLTASGGSSYLWDGLNNGVSITENILANKTITVEGTDGNGCTGRDTIFITTNPLPNVSITALETIICEEDSTTLTAHGAVSYLWNNNETTADIIVKPSSLSTYSVVGTDGNGCENTANISIDVKDCLGINENQFSFTVYPNPAKEFVVIQTNNYGFDKTEMSLMNISGKTLLKMNLINEETQLPINGYPSGIYFIKISSSQHSHIEKFIKY